MNMNKSKRIRIAAVAAAIAVAGSVTVYAAYDSSKDPLVSLSYLSQVFKPEIKGELKTELKNELKSELKSELKAELEAEIVKNIDYSVSTVKDSVKSELYDEFEALYSEPVEALQKQFDAMSNEYEVVTLEKNQRFKADAACEFVILSGNATVRCPATDSGIIDCTEGIILYEGQNVPQYHKLLVPDNGDGRGITSAGSVQLLVRGGYTIA